MVQFDAIATSLAAHASLKDTAQIVSLQTIGDLVIGQGMDLRKGIGNRSVTFADDFLVFSVAWFLAVFVLSIHENSISQAAGNATTN